MASVHSTATDVLASTAKTARLLPVDALRGLIIIFIALDHANHFVAHQHSSGEYWGDPFPSCSEPLAFLTRLVTHLSAPGWLQEFLKVGLPGPDPDEEAGRGEISV